MRGYLNCSLAPSTASIYSSVWNRYLRFCSASGVPSVPLNQFVISLFVTSLARSLQFGSIKAYLSAIQYHSNLLGLPEQISHMQSVYYLLRGIRRSQSIQTPRAKRPAISIQQLQQICSYINLKFFGSDRGMLRCAVSLAFFGLLRSAEYCCPTHTSFDQHSHLLVSDITLDIAQSLISVNIKTSKTDPFHTGCVLRIGAAPSLDICPVLSLHAFLHIHPTFIGPRFTFRNHSYLTRAFLSQILKSALPQLPYVDTHSLRIGGASAAAAAGIPDSRIRLLGRWSSDAYRQYLRLSDTTVHSVADRISRCNASRYFNTDTLTSDLCT